MARLARTCSKKVVSNASKPMRQLPPPYTPARPLPSKMQAAASGSVRRRKACRQAARLDEGSAGTDDMLNSVDLHASLAYMAEAVIREALKPKQKKTRRSGS